MPRGLFSSVPGFGIQILRTGWACRPRFRSCTSWHRPSGSRVAPPSTPGVFLPWLS